MLYLRSNSYWKCYALCWNVLMFDKGLLQDGNCNCYVLYLQTLLTIVAVLCSFGHPERLNSVKTSQINCKVSDTLTHAQTIMVLWTAHRLQVKDKFSHFPNAYIPLAGLSCPSVSVRLQSLHNQTTKPGDDRVTSKALQVWWVQTQRRVSWYLRLQPNTCKAL